MNFQEFGTQLDRLKEVYGDRAYPEARVKLIFNWSRRLHVDAFEAVVTKLIEECERTPLLGKFKEYYGQIRSTLPRSTVDCAYCAGSGLIVDPKSPPPFVAYACKCVIGESVSKTVARWKGEFVRCSPRAEDIVRKNTASIVTGTMKGIEG